jgi:hypothetical protein
VEKKRTEGDRERNEGAGGEEPIHPSSTTTACRSSSSRLVPSGQLAVVSCGGRGTTQRRARIPCKGGPSPTWDFTGARDFSYGIPLLAFLSFFFQNIPLDFRFGMGYDKMTALYGGASQSQGSPPCDDFAWDHQCDGTERARRALA